MEYVFKVNKEGFVSNYLKLFNGGLQLTNKEIDYLTELVLKYIKLDEQGLKEPFISQIIFDRKESSEIRKKLKMTPQSINNYKNQLKLKKIIIGEDDSLMLSPIIIPKKEINFKFIVE